MQRKCIYFNIHINTHTALASRCVKVIKCDNTCINVYNHSFIINIYIICDIKVYRYINQTTVCIVRDLVQEQGKMAAIIISRRLYDFII